MSSSTTNINLFKYDTVADKKSTFNINTALNDNFDKIDSNCINKAGTVAFTAEQKGIDASNSTGLTTLQQVQSLISAVNVFTADTSNMPTISNALLTGIISTTAGSATLTGFNTKFMTETSAGKIINIAGTYYTVASVSNDNTMTLTSPVSTTYSAIKMCFNDRISFNDGFCYDLLTKIKITSLGIIKKLDSIFATGNGNGGLDIGSKAISTCYHCFAISKPDGTSDFLFSLSPTDPTMPGDFINKRRIGSILIDSSGNIIPFIQNGNYFTFKYVIQTLNGSGNNARTPLTLPVPPNTRAFLVLYLTSSTSGNSYMGIYDKTCPNGGYVQIAGAPSAVDTIYGEVFVDSNSQVDYITGSGAGAPSSKTIQTTGYLDKRGTN